MSQKVSSQPHIWNNISQQPKHDSQVMHTGSWPHSGDQRQRLTIASNKRVQATNPTSNNNLLPKYFIHNYTIALICATQQSIHDRHTHRTNMHTLCAWQVHSTQCREVVINYFARSQSRCSVKRNASAVKRITSAAS